MVCSMFFKLLYCLCCAHARTHTPHTDTHHTHTCIQTQTLQLKPFCFSQKQGKYGFNNVNSIGSFTLAHAWRHACVACMKAWMCTAPASACAQDLLCDLVPCNLHLLIRTVEKPVARRGEIRCLWVFRKWLSVLHLHY